VISELYDFKNNNNNNNNKKCHTQHEEVVREDETGHLEGCLYKRLQSRYK